MNNEWKEHDANAETEEIALLIEIPQDQQTEEYRKSVAFAAKDILSAKNLPDCGESRLWINESINDKRPQNEQSPTFSMVSWNIERGYRVDDEIEYLRRANADILCLQEVDWNCIRTGSDNIALKIAKSLGYKYILFTTEFVEIDSNSEDHLKSFPHSKRHSSDRIGRGGGVHGQAILSRYPIEGTKVIKLSKQWFSWQDGTTLDSQKEPRKGQRIAQKVHIKIGDQEITLYNAHLENICGTTGRLAQLDEITNDAENDENPAIIVGDLNTSSHGIALLRKKDRQDFFTKLKASGETAAHLWQKMEFDNTPLKRKLNKGTLGSRKKSFNDPFHPSNTTFKIKPIYGGKLDWTLFESGAFDIENKKVGSEGISDHRPLLVTVRMK